MSSAVEDKFPDAAELPGEDELVGRGPQHAGDRVESQPRSDVARTRHEHDQLWTVVRRQHQEWKGSTF